MKERRDTRASTFQEQTTTTPRHPQKYKQGRAKKKYTPLRGKSTSKGQGLTCISQVLRPGARAGPYLRHRCKVHFFSVLAPPGSGIRRTAADSPAQQALRRAGKWQKMQATGSSGVHCRKLCSNGFAPFSLYTVRGVCRFSSFFFCRFLLFSSTSLLSSFPASYLPFDPANPASPFLSLFLLVFHPGT